MLLRHVVTHFASQYAQQQLQTALNSAAEQQQELAQTDVTDFSIAFVFGLGLESAGLVDHLQNTAVIRFPSFVLHRATSASGVNIGVVETGVGQKKADAAVRELLSIHRPDWIVSAGLSGGLQPGLRRGSIVMSNEVLDLAGNKLKIGLNMSEDDNTGIKVGKLLTVDRLIFDPDEKRELGQKHDAIACDMETMAIAKVCSEEAIRFLSVRIISDRLEDRLPTEIETLVEQGTLAAKLGAATRALFARPSSAKDMWKLREDALKASDKLGKFLLAILPQLLPGDTENNEDEGNLTYTPEN